MSKRELTEKQKKLYRLADYIEGLPDEQFDMASDCGTCCCIAGHVNLIRYGENGSHSAASAQQELGINHLEMRALFFPPGFSQGRYTKSQAVATLRHFARTGKVDWSAQDTLSRAIAQAQGKE